MDTQIRPIKSSVKSYRYLDIKGVKIFFSSDEEAKKAAMYCMQYNIPFMPGVDELYSRPAMFLTARGFLVYLSVTRGQTS